MPKTTRPGKTRAAPGKTGERPDFRNALTVQILKDAGGAEAFAVLPIARYRALVEEAGDARDLAAIAAARGEETVPLDIVKRLIAGDEHPLTVWREHRGLRGYQLAEKAGCSAPYLSEIEHGKKDGSVALFRKLAGALDVTLDDIVPQN